MIDGRVYRYGKKWGLHGHTVLRLNYFGKSSCQQLFAEFNLNNEMQRIGINISFSGWILPQDNFQSVLSTNWW